MQKQVLRYPELILPNEDAKMMASVFGRDEKRGHLSCIQDVLKEVIDEFGDGPSPQSVKIDIERMANYLHDVVIQTWQKYNEERDNLEEDVIAKLGGMGLKELKDLAKHLEL